MTWSAWSNGGHEGRRFKRNGKEAHRRTQPATVGHGPLYLCQSVFICGFTGFFVVNSALVAVGRAAHFVPFCGKPSQTPFNAQLTRHADVSQSNPIKPNQDILLWVPSLNPTGFWSVGVLESWDPESHLSRRSRNATADHSITPSLHH